MVKKKDFVVLSFDLRRGSKRSNKGQLMGFTFGWTVCPTIFRE